MKTADERLADTKAYLSMQITPAQYNEIMNLINAAPNKTAIADALSIGHTNPFIPPNER